MSESYLLKVSGAEVGSKTISFSIFPSKLLILYGQNGSGKTTLLRKIVLSKAEPSFDVRCNFSYLGHKFGLNHAETVGEFLDFSWRICGLKTSPVNMMDLLDRYQLHSNSKISMLSFGQIQKLGLIRVLMCEKTLWILDEPLSNVDALTQKLFLQDLEHHLSFQGAALIATHSEVPLLHESVYLS